jgi:hypothetical protein
MGSHALASDLDDYTMHFLSIFPSFSVHIEPNYFEWSCHLLVGPSIYGET